MLPIRHSVGYCLLLQRITYLSSTMSGLVMSCHLIVLPHLAAGEDEVEVRKQPQVFQDNV